jgi:hypothetical protein
LRYETYIAAGWKDGNGNKIKNWKLKAVNAIKYEKPWNYGNDEDKNKITPIRQSFAEQNAQAKKDILAKNMKSCS